MCPVRTVADLEEHTREAQPHNKPTYLVLLTDTEAESELFTIDLRNTVLDVGLAHCE